MLARVLYVRHLYFLLPLVLVLAACGGAHTATTNVVAEVAGRPITRPELDTYTRYAATFESVVYPESTEATCARRATRAACARFRAGVLARLIEERIVLDYAHRHHIRLTPGERSEASRQVQSLMAPSAPTARLFHLGVSRAFVSHIVDRQLLIQKVEGRIVGARAKHGFEYKIRKIGIPNSGSDSADNQAVMRIATTGKIPPGAAEKTEWMAPFRMTPGVRRAVAAARPGDYVGPFTRQGYVLVIQLLESGDHPYAAPARAALTSRLFATWLSHALKRAHPRCRGSSGALAPCPASMMKSA
jgi:hypothetical protein